MVLLFSSSCIQSTIQLISSNIMADGGYSADDDNGNTAEDGRDDVNMDNQNANRENVTVNPANVNPGNHGRMFYM